MKNITKEIFDFLPGTWKIVRKIQTKKLVDKVIKAIGYGKFMVSKEEPNVINYFEKVTIYNLGINTPPIEGTQKYKYEFDGVDSLSKFFPDGRLFYKLDVESNLNVKKASGSHLCNQDNYKASYIFKENQFTLIYSVNGPLKDYDIVTEYSKIDDEELNVLGVTLINEKII